MGETFDRNHLPTFPEHWHDFTNNTRAIENYDVSLEGQGRKRGLAIIMTNDFMDGQTTNTPLAFVNKDGWMLWSLFRTLGFDVIWHKNFGAGAMLQKIKGDVLTNDVGKMIVCCISSHGQQSVVIGQDGEQLWIKDIVDELGSFRDAAIKDKLHGKPKLFFVDACQGKYLRDADSLDRTLMKFDVAKEFSKIAENSDVLLGFAAYQGSPSIGTEDGSLYINELVKHLMLFHTTEDIHVILAAVCSEVQRIRLEFKKKPQSQLPMVFSTLRMRLIMD